MYFFLPCGSQWYHTELEGMTWTSFYRYYLQVHDTWHSSRYMIWWQKLSHITSAGSAITRRWSRLKNTRPLLMLWKVTYRGYTWTPDHPTAINLWSAMVVCQGVLGCDGLSPNQRNTWLLDLHLKPQVTRNDKITLWGSASQSATRHNHTNVPHEGGSTPQKSQAWHFGHMDAYVMQNCHLQYIHILLTMVHRNKLRTSTDIHCVVSADIPNESTKPELRQIVTSHMIHNLCVEWNSASPCMAE